MTATYHAAVGATLAAAISNPIVGIPVALLSHIVCDLIPHWDVGTHMTKKKTKRIFWESLLDVVLSIIVTFFLIFYIFPNTNLFYAFFMAFTAQFFDWITAPYYILNWKFRPFTWFYQFQSGTNTKLDKPLGIIIPTVIVLLLIFFTKFIVG